MKNVEINKNSSLYEEINMKIIHRTMAAIENEVDMCFHNAYPSLWKKYVRICEGKDRSIYFISKLTRELDKLKGESRK